MSSCGLYDYTGRYFVEVGLPSISGRSGGVMTIVPGIMGFCSYSAPLDKYGNSVRGLQFCAEMSELFGLHIFDIDRSNDVRLRQADKD